MKLFEYEAKDILRRNGISISTSYAVSSSEEAEAIAKEIGKPVVLKSQILVSGRGKSGGIRVASDATEARIIVDDNALFRHPEFEDRSSVRVDDSPLEAEARKQNLTYVDLSGDIGIVGNGAGLAMATLPW